MKQALFFSFAVTAAGLLWSQQPVLRTPPQSLSKAEFDALKLVPPNKGKSVTKTLFDGKTLNGWQGDLSFWSVRDGAILGKSDGKVPTTFLYTKDTYSDFRLTLSSKMVVSENHAGVCFWGEVVEGGGTQFGTKGPLVMFPDPGMWDYGAANFLRVFSPTTEKVTSQHEWIKVEMLAQGNQVRTAFNGVEVMQWREPDASHIKVAPIGVQLHGWNGPQEVLYKDIVVETFPRQSKLITLKK